MKTVVLDDDPTGTQSATGVPVLLRWDTALLTDTLKEHHSVYLQTNSRALDEDAAVALSLRIRDQVSNAEALLGDQTRIVLRGDSTLRGHVFAETDVFATRGTTREAAPVLFVPAFPAGGRTTLGGVHRVEIDGLPVPAHETEYAEDPVFPFSTGEMVGYVREKGDRAARIVPLDELRQSGGMAVTDALLKAGPMSFVVPDALTEEDIDLVHAGLEATWAKGKSVVVRSAAPLAARIARCQSNGLLPTPLFDEQANTLFVCGSHTSGATVQLEQLSRRIGVPVVTVPTANALADPVATGQTAANEARESLSRHGAAIIASERKRRDEDNTLAHGAAVMRALTTTVGSLARDVSVVVAKGGITSAEVAAGGLSADRAVVRGQLLPGVSEWDLETPLGTIPYVVVPGNVGGPDAIGDIADALGVSRSAVTDGQI